VKVKSLYFVAILSLLLIACDTVDCTLNNAVYCYLSFYNNSGEKVAISDTLSISAYGTKKSIYNRGVKKSDVAIPMSYYNAEDTLTFAVTSNESTMEAEIVIGKTNTQFFESPDCPVNMFHNITSAYVFSGQFIDSVVVVKPTVNFQQDENIRIYLH